MMTFTTKTAGVVRVLVLGAAGLGLAGCSEFPSLNRLTDPAKAGAGEDTVSETKLVERDIEAPEVFDVTEAGLWDGRPSLGGVWVAHPDVEEPERVIIRNTANGKFVIGALFRRERDIPGPRLQASSDAAAALGMLAQTLVWNGQYEEAKKVIEPRIKGGNVTPDMIVACIDANHKLKDHEETIQAAPRANVGLSPAFHPRSREVAVPAATHRGIRELDVVHSSSIDRTRIDADSSAPTPSWDAVLSRTAARSDLELVAGRSPRHGAADRLGGADASSGHP